MAPRREKSTQRRTRIRPPCGLNRCVLVLGVLIALQLGGIIVMQSLHHRREGFSRSPSLMISENLESFLGGIPLLGGQEDTVTPDGEKEDSIDVASLYSRPDETSNNLWDKSTILPQWMKDYFVWHGEQLEKLDKDRKNWKNMRFLVMQCLKEDGHCGGTADRLKPVPTMLLLANQTGRVLMIRWERPCKLEEFLLPPQGGLDWRVPEWLEPQLPRKPFAPGMHLSLRLSQSPMGVAMTRYQAYHAGSPYFDEHTNGTGITFSGIYHELWQMVFTPVPPIASMIRDSMQSMGLVPGQYAAAHLRALYARKDRPLAQTESMAHNAVNCASKLNPGAPIYFAADSQDAVSVIHKYASDNNRKIVSLKDDKDPLHLEKATNWQDRQPSEYYETFRDLYVLGLADCVAYNVGGFGHWGLLLSGNSTCGMRYVTGDARHRLIGCDWTDGEPKEPPPTSSLESLLFKPPIGIDFEDPKGDDNDEKERVEMAHVKKRSDSSTLPPWLEEYFQWHKEQRSDLSEKNWESKKFLVMQCTEEDDRCGGTADRLKPLPALLFQAHRCKRILLIHWDRPCQLEEFLVSPPGGLDWHVPEWMLPKLANTPKMKDLRRINRFLHTYNDIIFRTRVQSVSGGLDFYKNWTSTSYDSFYHEMFHKVFTPSPPLAKEISANMHRLGLQPGEYAAAHLRAMYARSSRPEEEVSTLAINAVNCASQLRPGGPIYFAADNKHAVESVQKYGQEYNRPVVGLIHDEEPLHLEKAVNGTERHPSDYFATFVDLYLLGESRCLSYSIGGFGTWGLLLGYNSSCSNRHLQGHHMAKCEWADAPAVK